MFAEENIDQLPPFLQVPGEMSVRIGSFNWANTPLGPLEQWPATLKFSVNMMLSSAFPAMICWGRSFVQIYNDSFRSIIGLQKHSAALGESASATFSEIWQTLGPLFHRAMEGETVSAPDTMLALNDGLPEEQYFQFSFSPVRDESGEVQAVFVVCIETTKKVMAFNDLNAYKNNIKRVIRQAPVGICIVNGDSLFVTEVNSAFLQIIGKRKDELVNRPYKDAYNSAEAEHESIVEQVIRTGREHTVKEYPLTVSNAGIQRQIFVDFVYEPVRNIEGLVTGAVIVANNVTDKVWAKNVLQELNEEMAASNAELVAANDQLTNAEKALQDSLDRLTVSEQQIQDIIAGAPFPIAVYIGREMRIVQANQAIIDVWGKGNEVIGKTYHELLPELEEQEIYPQLNQVFDTGIAFHARNRRIRLDIAGTPTEFYFNYSFTPLKDNTGKVYGVMNTAADVTDLNIAKIEVEQSVKNFQNIILQAPVAMCLLTGPGHIIELVNEGMLEIWGRPIEKVLGRSIFDVLPDARQRGLDQVMEKVYETGVPFRANEQPVFLVRHGNPEIVYQNFVYHPYSSDGRISGVLVISVNVTEQVNAKHELERAYEQTRLSKEAAQLGTFDMNLQTGTLEWDKRCRELFGIAHEETITYEKDFLKGLHPDDFNRVVLAVEAAQDKSLTNGNYDIEYRTLGAADQKLRWVRAKGKVYFDQQDYPLRFVGSILDITDEKLREIRSREVAEKHGHLAAIVDTSDDVIVSKNLDGIITSWNKSAEAMFGYRQEEAIGKHISLIIPPARLQEEDFIISRIKAGQKVDHFETIRIDRQGREKQLSITISPILDADGKIIGASKIARDISTQNEAKKAIQHYTARLEVMNTMIEAISEELDINKIIQKVTDSTTELTGAQFGAFFYNMTDENGESYMLFALSGAPREAFESFGMPRNTALFHPTFSGQEVVRVDDITKDPRYGKNLPHQGMPEGHLPVVSYLAVPVVSRSGNVIGGLFFGHPEPGVFTQENENLVVSIAAQAAIGLDNAKLYEEVKALNDKKDEFIVLASHELKTPLTSISGYLQILNRQEHNDQVTKFLGKAYTQVQKLTALVNDLLDISKIEAGKLSLTIAEFDLVAIIEDAIELVKQTTNSYEITFEPEEAQFMVSGDGQRIQQVVLNLLTNAIKYSPGAELVEVFLNYEDDAVKVGVRDYGLGIAPEKQQHIFSRFYRIEEATPNISGLGIGLYLSNEIVTRHNGRIWVESETGKGSTFWFTLPKQ